MAAKIVVTIRHIRWREGRPRFDPSPGLRALGFKGEDLKTARGWMSLDETRQWLDTVLEPRIAAARAARDRAAAEGRPALKPRQLAAAARPPAGLLTVGAMVAQFFALPEAGGSARAEGRRQRKALRPATVKGYRKLVTPLSRIRLWAEPAHLVGARGIDEALAEIERRHGLATARHCRALLSKSWQTIGRSKGLANPVRDAERLPVPEGRIRPATRAEIAAMVKAAEAMGRPEVADMICFGVLYAQRQTDVLTLTDAAIEAGRLRIVQSKTGRRLTLPLSPPFAARLAAAAERRRALKVQWPHVFIDEKAGRPWAPEGDYFRHVWARIRASAALACPSVADLRYQDLRDTAMTWLASEGIEFARARQLSGHSRGSEAMAERHYIDTEQVKGASDAVAVLAKLWTGTKEE